MQVQLQYHVHGYVQVHGPGPEKVSFLATMKSLVDPPSSTGPPVFKAPVVKGAVLSFTLFVAIVLLWHTLHMHRHMHIGTGTCN